MNDLDDAQLEARVRRTLQAVAEATPVEAQRFASYDGGGRRRSRGWLAPAAGAAAAVALVLGTVVVVGGDDGEVTVESPSSSATTPTTAATAAAVVAPEAAPGARSDGPVYTAAGDAHAVADAYLRDRGVHSPTHLQEVDGRAAASWNVNDSTGVVAEGTVYLALVGERWAVVEAITEGVVIDDLQVEDGRLTATVSTTGENSFVFEVLDTDGNRFRGGERIGPTHPSLDVDVTIGDEPVVLRAQLIGGSMLSVTEILVDPGAPDGAAFAEGLWEGGGWRVLGAEAVPRLEDSPCGWIELNGVAQGATCGVDGEVDGFHVFGPVARHDEETLYFGVVGRRVTSVRITIDSGQIIEAATFADRAYPDGARYVALSVPSTSPAIVELLADGTVVAQTETDPSGPIGS
jgi:hypothetical protein